MDDIPVSAQTSKQKNNNNKQKTFFLSVLFLCTLFFAVASINSVSAATAAVNEITLPLLAVQELDDGSTRGHTASLTIKTLEGQGKVFTATYPLTKIDTQISARFAKEMACHKYDISCIHKDFIYEIQASSPIIAGPSAGAALTIGTIASLQNKDLKKNIAITGTINSGGLIGPVGGVKEKIEGAADKNISTVLIPYGTRYYKTKSEEQKTQSPLLNKILHDINKTELDLVEYGQNLNVSVIEVVTLEEAYAYFLGEPYIQEQNIEIENQRYEETMHNVADMLCSSSEALRQESQELIVDNRTQILYDDAVNLTTRANAAKELGAAYSAASFCFGANVKFRNILLTDKSLDQLQQEMLRVGRTDIDAVAFSSINNLQTYIVVKDRIDEKDENIEDAVEVLQEYANITESDENSKEQKEAKRYEAIAHLAYATERLESAKSWSLFFIQGQNDDTFTTKLANSCNDKLAQAEERYQYAAVYFPNIISSTRPTLNKAYKYADEDDLAMCLFYASKVTAEANVILSGLGVTKEQLPTIAEKKLAAAKQEIARQKDLPILAYSYYVYGTSLLETDPSAATLYAEYALEFADLSIYFKELKTEEKKSTANIIQEQLYLPKEILLLIAGILLGWFAKHLHTPAQKQSKKKRSSKAKSKEKEDNK